MIQNKVFNVIKKISQTEQIEESDTLEKLGFDSLEMVILLLEIEEAFGITLTESDMDPFELNKVSDIVSLVKKYAND